MNKSNRFQFLFEKKDAHALGAWRIILGCLLLWDLTRWIHVLELHATLFSHSLTNFHYNLLPFLKPIGGENGMKWIMILVAISIVMVILGWKYRFAIISFFIGFFYLFYIDQSIYNNHLYLMSVLAFLLIFIKADKAFSLGNKGGDKLVPAWNYYILQFMIIVVYFYGGIAKLTHEWVVLNQPVKTMLDLLTRENSVAGAFNNSFGIALITYGGLVFDLVIGFLLLFKKTRYIAIPALLIFNLMNALVLFDDINIFPYFMIFSTILFFNPLSVRAVFEKWNLIKSFKTKHKKRESTSAYFPYNKKVVIGLSVFIILQCIIPFRHHVFPGYPDWYMEGQRFSWRMKTQTRDIQLIRFHVTNTDYQINNVLSFSLWKDGDRFTEETLLPKGQLIALTDDQIKLMAFNPDAVWQFAQYIDKWMETDKKFNAPNVEVRAEILVGLNGREPQNLVDPVIDLLKVENNPFKHKGWIVPLRE